MPETSLEIRVSRRELDRPRLVQAVAVARDGSPYSGLALLLSIDAHGSFHGERESITREATTADDGYALFQWYEWPRDGERRDFVSVISAAWGTEDALVYLEDLHE